MLSVLIGGGVVATLLAVRAAIKRIVPPSLPQTTGRIQKKRGETVTLSKDMIIWSATYRGLDVSKTIRDGLIGFERWEFVVKDNIFDIPETDDDDGWLLIDWEVVR